MDKRVGWEEDGKQRKDDESRRVISCKGEERRQRKEMSRD